MKASIAAASGWAGIANARVSVAVAGAVCCAPAPAGTRTAQPSMLVVSSSRVRPATPRRRDATGDAAIRSAMPNPFFVSGQRPGVSCCGPSDRLDAAGIGIRQKK